MSQILQAKNGARLYQDIFFTGKKSCIETSANEAICYVCGKGLPHGFSVTAKNLKTGTLLFCEKHYSM